MPDLVNKLSTYAALLGVIGAIGGGFMAWGEFNNRIAQLENKEFGISPGQACVFYSKNKIGDKMLGGGWIDSNYL